ncbi:MAG: histidine kinase dimerization/phospho-acceptor domain-containing protein, partial [Pseudomonadota bacterium]
MISRLGFKFALSLFLAVAVSVLAISVFSVWREASRYVETRTIEIVGIARVLASASADALAERDRNAALRSFRSIRDMAGVSHVRLEDTDGRIFAEAGSTVVLDRDIAASNERDPIAVLFGRPLTVAVPVRHGGAKAGNLILTAETADVWPRIAGSLVTLFMASLVTIVVGLIAATVITRRMVKPIQRLRNAMIDLRKTQNFATRVAINTDDEVGELTEAFNDLLTQIRKRDQALDAHRASLEDTVTRRTEALAIAKDDAEQANRAKSVFLATMSHEIRTPMNGMLALTELLAEAPLPEREKRYAHTVNRSGAALLSIINDILDYSKIEAGNLTLEWLPCDVRTILTDVLDIFADRAGEKGLALAGHVRVAVPTAVIA